MTLPRRKLWIPMIALAGVASLGPCGLSARIRRCGSWRAGPDGPVMHHLTHWPGLATPPSILCSQA